jgi:isopentenyl-diphosphate Delta-isomerase
MCEPGTGQAVCEGREMIVLVDHDGCPTGTAEKWSSHHDQTPLHLGFSCYVFDSAGRFLATRRAESKKVWPGVWTNTVCGHPAPGESCPEAIERRLAFELGITAHSIRLILPSYRYRTPSFRGVVEHELCPVFSAVSDAEPQPNPDEVSAWRWMQWREFVASAKGDPEDAFSWWCKDQLQEIDESALPI